MAEQFNVIALDGTVGTPAKLKPSEANASGPNPSAFSHKINKRAGHRRFSRIQEGCWIQNGKGPADMKMKETSHPTIP